MERNLVLFLLILSFISGVLYASLGLTILYSLIPAALLAAALYASNIDLRIAAAAGILMITGSAYYVQDDYRYQSQVAHLSAQTTISDNSMQGIVSADPKHQSDYQSLYLKTPHGTIAIQTDTQPKYIYGDTLTASGKIEAPTPPYFSRHVVGIMRNPSITRDAEGGGNPVLTFLFNIKNTVNENYAKLLPSRDAALLSGIMFGSNDFLSPDFSNQLQLSGLRFITAIDGLHIQIVILIIFGALSYLLPRKYAYVSTFIFVVLYVALTGFTIPGIRASFMALIAVIARETGRLYMPHTILACGALILALLNPKVLLFDAGFQLSFLAVIAIVYLLPVLRHLAHLRDEPGFLGWRESLLITISVQLATAPVVITQFQSFTLTSFVASVVVVWMLPFILALGFLLSVFSLVLYPLAVLLSVLIAPMMEFVVIVVSLFSRVAVLYNPSLGFPGIALYYGALVSLMYWQYHARQAVTPPARISAEAASFEIIESA